MQPDIYNGDLARYGRAGHIPGSHNVYYNSLLNPSDGTYLPLDHPDNVNKLMLEWFESPVSTARANVQEA